MGALNSVMLWGGLGAVGVAVPIVIHLLYRKHRKQTDWAAMELLRRALVLRSGQVKLEDYLILAMRCLALLLVAAALLRPTLSSDAGAVLGDNVTGVIIGIDASMSMGHGEYSRYERAVAKAKTILSTVSEGAPVSVLLMGEEPEVLVRGMDYDEATLVGALDARAEPTFGRMNLDRAIEQIEELIGETKTAGKEVYFITDGQENDWSAERSFSPKMIDAFERISGEATVFVVPVDSEGDANFSISELAYTSGSLHRAGVARFTTVVRNEGRERMDGGVVTFHVNDVQSKRSTVGVLDPGESRGLSFHVSFDRPGAVRLHAQLTGDDLAADNVRRAVANVSPVIKVLAVEGGTAGDVASGAFYAAKALQPRELVEDGAIRVNRIPSPEIGIEDFRDYDVILLADVGDIPTETVGKLQRFVERGGGLIVFVGENVDPTTFNERMGVGVDGMLPGRLVEALSYDGPETGWTFGAADSRQMLADVVSRVPENVTSLARLRKVIRVEPTVGSKTLLNVLEPGVPLLIGKTMGRGSVLLFTTAADRSWGDFPLNPLFTILLQQAVTQLTSQPETLQFLVGETAELGVEGREVGDVLALTESMGNQRSLRVVRSGNRSVVKLKFEEPGFYELAGDGGLPGPVVAANVNPEEGRVRVLDSSVLNQDLSAVGVQVIAEDSALIRAIEASRSGRELSQILLWAGILVFVAQSLLAKYFTNRMGEEKGSDVASTLQMSHVAAARRS